MEFSEIEARLAGLISEFGPTSRTSQRQSAAYPFTHLRSDGVWVLDSDVPMDRVSFSGGVCPAAWNLGSRNGSQGIRNCWAESRAPSLMLNSHPV